MTTLLEIEDGQVARMPTPDDAPQAVHLFDERSIYAVNAALLARRPLLVCGEPGTGKSQLARAVAFVLKRVFVSQVVDARTEPRDLLWWFDAVRRLAEAQLISQVAGEAETRMAIQRFMVPGPLWWAFDWKTASDQAGELGLTAPEQAGTADPANGCVVLIDEIDKAERDVPNALLEALGIGQFTPEGFGERIKMKPPLPLVIITSNRERSLPDAFVRRCLVLNLELPREEKALRETLGRIGRTHFPNLDESIIGACLDDLVADRKRAGEASRGGPRPGQAEFLDLLRILHHSGESDPDKLLGILKRMKPFVLEKHVGLS